MPMFNGSVYSSALCMNTGLTVVFPRSLKKDGKPFRVIYMLHGLSDDHSCWGEFTQLPWFSEKYQVMFVMPEVQHSWYADMKYGMNYFEYVSKELPEICKQLFHISNKREDTAVMGLSMGGYGALKCALTYPEKYSLCCAFSSSCDINRVLSNDFGNSMEYVAGFGIDLKSSPKDDLYKLAEKCAKKSKKPQFYMTCGTEDYLLEVNHKFRDHMQQLDLPFQYKEWTGVHDWYFWNDSLKLMLDTFYAPKG